MFKKGTGKIISNIPKKTRKDFNDILKKIILKYGEDNIQKMSREQITKLILNEKGE